MGWERMDEVPTDEGNFLISCAADKDWESPLGHIYTGYYAVMAQKYWQVFGKAEASFRRTLAEISVKHHGYARFNPFAHGADEDHGRRRAHVARGRRPAARPRLLPHERGRRLRHPLRRGHGHGADQGQPRTSRSASGSTAGSHTLRPADRRDMEIPLLPNETRRPVQEPGQGIPRRRALSRASPASSRRAWPPTTPTA